ncbi:delta-delta-dienoyl-CoA isomerase-like protein [Phyllosticta citrichinensis]|uniref:Delta-delta-dienoyl-CoA isomerase-like protein n=1 Tax=Phyllosticta citrichinensis TaxID=1130410 RepID=A0ABR1Y372_9PEZI
MGSFKDPSKSSKEPYSYEYFNVTFPSEYVAHVEINRPEKLNAFIEVMWLNLGAIFARLSHDPNVRAVLLTGAGPRAFTAGLDVQAASQSGVLGDSSDGSEQDIARKSIYIKRHIEEFQACVTAIEKCEKPVVAAMHGHTYGLGLDIALCADMRVAAATTSFSIKEVDIGIAADIGVLTRLPKVTGHASFAKEIALTARMFTPAEALNAGLLSYVLPTKDEAVAKGLGLCKLVATKSPVAVVGTKELVNYSRDRPTEEGLKYTSVWNMGMIQTEDVKRALMSGLQRRKPTFEKL